MSTTPVLNGQIIGQTEHATRALLDSLLAKAGTNYHQWVALRQTRLAGNTIAAEALQTVMTHALKVDASVATETFAQISAAGWATSGATIELTEAGIVLHDQIWAEIGEVTGRLYGDLPQHELEIAARILILVTDRANTLLAA